MLQRRRLVLYETAAICLHLVDTHPEAGWRRRSARWSAPHFYKWLIWMTNSLQATMVHYFYPDRSVDAGNTEGAAQVQAARAAAHRRTLSHSTRTSPRTVGRGCWASSSRARPAMRS